MMQTIWTILLTWHCWCRSFVNNIPTDIRGLSFARTPLMVSWQCFSSLLSACAALHCVGVADTLQLELWLLKLPMLPYSCTELVSRPMIVKCALQSCPTQAALAYYSN